MTNIKIKISKTYKKYGGHDLSVLNGSYGPGSDIV